MKLDLGDQLKGVKKLSKKEKRIVRECVEIEKGIRIVKQPKDLSKAELQQLLNDCYETDKALDSSKPNYALAKHSLTALTNQVEKELKNRG